MMSDRSKTKEQLIQELTALRKRLADLAILEKEHGKLIGALARAEERFRLLYEQAPVGYQSLDAEGCLLEINQAWLDLFGYTREEVIGRWFGSFLSPRHIDRFRENFPRFKAQGEIHGIEFEMVRKDGSMVIASFDGRIGYDGQGAFKQTHCVLQDITDRKRAEDALRESEERYRTAIEFCNDGVKIVQHGRYVYVNKRMAEMCGYESTHDIIGEPMALLIHPDDRSKVIEANERRLSGEPVPSHYEVRSLRRDGSSFETEASATTILYKGDPATLVFTRDIRERKQLERRLRKMSLLDDLTGLYNRRGFFALADQQIKLAARTNQTLLLFFADADNMKDINDSLGHRQGDRALKEIAYTLKDTFRQSDVIGRIGGDEFAVLAVNTALETGHILLTRLRAHLDRYNKRDRKDFTLSLSVGTARYDPEHPSSLDELMAHADRLMYEEKRGKLRSNGGLVGPASPSPQP